MKRCSEVSDGASDGHKVSVEPISIDDDADEDADEVQIVPPTLCPPRKRIRKKETPNPTNPTNMNQQLEVYKMIHMQRRQEETLSEQKAIELQEQDRMEEARISRERQQQEVLSQLKVKELQSLDLECLNQSSSNHDHSTPSNPFTEQNELGILLKVFVGDGDNGEMTEGILNGFLKLHQSNMIKNVRPLTCISDYDDHVSSIPVLHIKQRDKWSCGYRNLQMLLSFLLPILPHSHTYIRRLLQHSVTKPLPPLPSIQQIQTHMEQSWADGFDVKAKVYFAKKNRNKTIVGTKSKIGAVDVCSLLRYHWDIDSMVVQFINNDQSRSMIGAFVWSYFERKGDLIQLNSETVAKQLLRNAKVLMEIGELSSASMHAMDPTETLGGKKDANSICMTSVPPLYLQWEGHSVTVVGVERQNSKDYNFLVMDPQKDGSKMKDVLNRCLESGAMKHHDKACLNEMMMLPVGTLKEKDCQLILCSLCSLNSHDKAKFKATPNGITAGI